MAEKKLTSEDKIEKERLNRQHMHALKIQSLKRQERALFNSNTTLEWKEGGRTINKNK